MNLPSWLLDGNPARHRRMVWKRTRPAKLRRELKAQTRNGREPDPEFIQFISDLAHGIDR